MHTSGISDVKEAKLPWSRTEEVALLNFIISDFNLTPTPVSLEIDGFLLDFVSAAKGIGNGLERGPWDLGIHFKESNEYAS